MSTLPRQRILVLGASGLLGHYLAVDLGARGHAVVAAARRFTDAQKSALTGPVLEASLVEAGSERLADMIDSYAITLIVNCVGILQDGPGGDTQSAHGDFVAHLLRALGKAGRPVPLIHISIPGEPADERTAFSITKRKADDLIAASGAPYAILRPGFVIAPAAFGGSALVRALAASPFDLPEVERARPFPAIGIADLADTVARLADRWNGGAWSDADWDVMHPDQTTVAAVIAAHRRWLGTSSRRRITLPAGLLNVGAWAADLAGWLGWRPPIRSTALAELRRGVRGDPGPWLAATGLEPRPLVGVLREMPATVQERWFARLYIMKGLIIPSLVVFWVVSGLIALTAYPAAVGILTSHGFSPALAHVTTVLSSLLDIGVGLAIAHRRTCRMGLRVGIAVSLFYMAGAALITPELWIEPLGALVKTGPAIVLMLVALAVLDER